MTSPIRTLGTVPISVGTALAVEAFQNTPMYRFQSFLINIRTIIRNARESFEELPNEDSLFESVKEDMVGIAEYINSLKLKTILDLKFYYPSYQSLPRLFPFAKLKEMDPKKLTGPKEQNRREQILLDNGVIKRILKEFDKYINQVDCSIPQFGGDGLILTHLPVDLVTTESYARLHLLESYTGTIKNFPLFSTKLTGASELPNVPLNKLTIQVFGDRANHFYAQPMNIKNEIKQLATSVPWSTGSTVSFVRNSINKLPNTNPAKPILLKMI
ncbi:putative head-tail protein [Aeromonas phage ZPAH34]|uniref:putative head-tail protein n=1 Tax=Aeromonas phage ZPAH34 TaxID=2924888 RepID=UPI002329356B|nr:putative head-tail protein [Aeromonas phage ZPAH34]UOX39641.1 putative head-tail protein [Aeromonas phage ZPAH34]